tara:strand:- start:166 stop:435 length:270 start_codon:yes stop_codon:yes gene_type:complete
LLHQDLIQETLQLTQLQTLLQLLLLAVEVEEDFHQVDTTQEEAQEDQGALVISSCQFLNLLDHNHGTLVDLAEARDRLDRLVNQEVAQV